MRRGGGSSRDRSPRQCPARRASADRTTLVGLNSRWIVFLAAVLLTTFRRGRLVGMAAHETRDGDADRPGFDPYREFRERHRSAVVRRPPRASAGSEGLEEASFVAIYPRPDAMRLVPLVIPGGTPDEHAGNY